MIDLHVHSTASDGTVAPAELASRGRDFALMALTDHDNMDGTAEFLAAPRGRGVRLPGIELSVDPGAGYGIFHLLGLGLDSANPALQQFLRRILDGRNARNEKIRAAFARLGIDMPAAELAHYAHGEVLARPHFAQWLVDHGYARDTSTAFATYLARTSPPETNCYVARYRPDPGEAIDIIHGARGLAVMAHPRFWTDDPARLRAGLAAWRARGLDGVEAIYQANTQGETVEHRRVARAMGLLVTAGSDFHGTNKPSIPLGMAVNDEPELCRALLAALEKAGAVMV